MPEDGVQEYAKSLTYRGLLHIDDEDLERKIMVLV